jgi:hypothetical protein
MWIKLVVACCAKCAVLAVGTVDATCPSQQGGTIASGMPEKVRHTPFPTRHFITAVGILANPKG